MLANIGKRKENHWLIAAQVHIAHVAVEAVVVAKAGILAVSETVVLLKVLSLENVPGLIQVLLTEITRRKEVEITQKTVYVLVLVAEAASVSAPVTVTMIGMNVLKRKEKTATKKVLMRDQLRRGA